MAAFDWTPIRYRNVISVLKNPFYAGVYAYGKSEKHTAIVDGRARKSYGHGKPLDEWEVMLKDHHEGYIDWAEFERHQKQLAANAYGKVEGAKSGRGGRAFWRGFSPVVAAADGCVSSTPDDQANRSTGATAATQHLARPGV